MLLPNRTVTIQIDWQTMVIIYRTCRFLLFQTKVINDSWNLRSRTYAVLHRNRYIYIFAMALVKHATNLKTFNSMERQSLHPFFVPQNGRARETDRVRMRARDEEKGKEENWKVGSHKYQVNNRCLKYKLRITFRRNFREITVDLVRVFL